MLFMKMRFLFTPVLILFCSTALLAQIPNADFELWTDMGDWDDPDGWYTLNELYDGDPETVRTTGDAISGLTAARMENAEDNNGNVVRAMLLSGTKSLNNHPGFAFSDRPYSLEGYCQYSPQDDDDSCYVIVHLTKYNTSTQQRDIIGSGMFGSGDDMDDYILFSAPINYYSSLYPDTAYIEIYAGKFNGALDGSRLLIDALSFNETTTAEGIAIAGATEISVYPNPAHGFLNVKHLPVHHAAVLNLFDYTGMLKKSVPVSGEELTVDLSGLTTGIYFYEISTGQEDALKRGKLMIQ